jgi:hypothetical protein
MKKLVRKDEALGCMNGEACDKNEPFLPVPPEGGWIRSTQQIGNHGPPIVGQEPLIGSEGMLSAYRL